MVIFWINWDLTLCTGLVHTDISEECGVFSFKFWWVQDLLLVRH